MYCTSAPLSTKLILSFFLNSSDSARAVMRIRDKAGVKGRPPLLRLLATWTDAVGVIGTSCLKTPFGDEVGALDKPSHEPIQPHNYRVALEPQKFSDTF